MKKVLMVCLSLMLAGVALVVLGAATGADKTVSLTRGGFASAAETKKTVVSEENLSFDRLNISAGSVKVEVVAGDSFGYTLENVSDAMYSVKNVNGELTVEVRAESGVALFPFAALTNDLRVRVIVTVPESVTLKALTVAIASGDMRLDRVAASQMVVTSASGEISMNAARAEEAVLSCASGHVEIDGITARKLTVSVGSGRLRAKNISTDALTAQVVSGSLEMSGDLRGDTSVKVTSGDAALSFAAPIHDYRRSVSVTSGDVYVNGVKNPGNDTNSAAKYSLTASVTSGSLRLDFAE